MLLQKINRWRERGIGMLELMLSLSLVSVMLVMATRYYRQASVGAKVNDTLTNLQAIMSAAQAYRASTPGSAFGITDLTGAGLLPDAATKNAWGSSITVTATAAGTDYTIATGATDAVGCKQIVTAMKPALTGTVPTCNATGGSVNLVIPW